MGGEQRFASGFADVLIEDDADELRQTLVDLASRGVAAHHRSEAVSDYRNRLAKIDPSRPPDGPMLCRLWPRRDAQ
jgi:malonate decarboxylase beta subunit